MSWNLFHGRDWPPEEALQVRRGRLSGRTVRGERYAQVNRELFEEFAALIERVDWHVLLLQECPPRWRRPLARRFEAEAHRVLTARNWLHPVTGAIARWRPDLLGSSEGGSNLTLIRGAAGKIAERRSRVLTRRPERRVMALTRLDSGICVANIHVSTGRAAAERDVVHAADLASDFADADPLLFGGDFNVRPREGGIFDQLAKRFALAPATAPDRLTHLLVRGLEVVEHPAAWPPEARDVTDERSGMPIRISDHNPVVARFARVA